MLATLLCCTFLTAPAPPDTLYLQGQKIACTIKEVGPEAIKYTYPGEEALNLVYPNQVQKIVFASGRVQVFAPSRSLPASPSDWQKVALTQVEAEVRGMTRVVEISATAKGGTNLAGAQPVRERAEHKLKMQAAMLGGSTVFLTGTQVAKNDPDAAAQASIGGVVYTDHVPTVEELKAKIGSETRFACRSLRTYSNSAYEASERSWKDRFVLEEVLAEPGKTILKGALEHGEAGRYRLVYLGSESFFLQFRRGEDLCTIELLYR